MSKFNELFYETFGHADGEVFSGQLLIAVKIHCESFWNEALEEAKQAALSVEPAHIEREIDKLRVKK